MIDVSGLVYLLMKHLVDRYNIYFAYGPSKIDKDIHASAINFVIVGVILLQCAVCFFDILRAGTCFLFTDKGFIVVNEYFKIFVLSFFSCFHNHCRVSATDLMHSFGSLLIQYFL